MCEDLKGWLKPMFVESYASFSISKQKMTQTHNMFGRELTSA
jgi:hypothetical protein